MSDLQTAICIEVLRQVHEAGIHTWVFIAPILPMDAERLIQQILPYRQA